MRWVLILVVLSFGLVYLSSRSDTTIAWQPILGTSAPDYTARTLAGDSVSLSDYVGESLLLNIWGTWCSPCIRELPDIVRLHDEFKPHGLEVLTVSVNEEDPARADQFLASLGAKWINLHDSLKRLRADFPDGAGVPYSLLIDRDGLIRQRWRGSFVCGASLSQQYIMI